jgi:hypothetical protein
MKTLQFSLVGFAASLVLAAGAFGESTQQLLTEAQTAYLRGDFETAKKTFLLVNKIDPRNQTAIGYLRMIAVEEKKRPAGNTQQKELEKLIVPKIDFRDATLGSALDFLKQSAAKNSDGKITVSFVLQIPDEQIKTQKVSLSLGNVPFTEALRYLGELAKVDFSYEKYAIVVKPHSAAPTTPAAPAPGS